MSERSSSQRGPASGPPPSGASCPKPWTEPSDSRVATTNRSAFRLRGFILRMPPSSLTCGSGSRPEHADAKLMPLLSIAHDASGCQEKRATRAAHDDRGITQQQRIVTSPATMPERWPACRCQWPAGIADLRGLSRPQRLLHAACASAHSLLKPGWTDSAGGAAACQAVAGGMHGTWKLHTNWVAGR